MSKFWFGTAICLITAIVHADSWMPPQAKTYISKSGLWRLVVEPRPISSPLRYFEDKVANREPAGSLEGNGQTSATGVMEHLDGGHWQVAWKVQLANEVAPVDALVSDNGQAATFDNWHSMGFGDNAVVIYDAHGKIIHTYALQDFLPKDYVRALPRSVSSIQWRGKPVISRDGLEVEIPTVIPRRGDYSPRKGSDYIAVRFDLATGSYIPDASPAWSDALQSARDADAEQRSSEAAARARFISPLTSPASNDIRAWHAYLIEAFFRLDPDWKEGYPATKVVFLPGDPGYEKSIGWVREALTDELNATGVTMFASPSQDVLLSTLKREGARLGPGARARARIYLALDSAHFAAARGALAHSGATILQLDPNTPSRNARNVSIDT